MPLPSSFAPIVDLIDDARMSLSAKNFDDPDELIEMPGLLEEVVELGGFVIGRERM